MPSYLENVGKSFFNEKNVFKFDTNNDKSKSDNRFNVLHTENENVLIPDNSILRYNHPAVLPLCFESVDASTLTEDDFNFDDGVSYFNDSVLNLSNSVNSDIDDKVEADKILQVLDPDNGCNSKGAKNDHKKTGGKRVLNCNRKGIGRGQQQKGGAQSVQNAEGGSYSWRP